MTNKKRLQWWVFLVSGWFISSFLGNSPFLQLIGDSLVVYGIGLGILTLIKKIKEKNNMK
ncbi:MAG: hypothetical protein WC320_01735 [Candidatus Paceibacterota bacterium]|jgi:F0F1-type ATP synthase assembly protein I